MKIKQLLDDSLLILPKNWKELGYKSYYECVINEGSKYLELLTELDESEFNCNDNFLGELSKRHLIEASREFYQAIYKTLQAYFNEGNPHKAYNVFDQSIKEGSFKSLSFYFDYSYLYPINYRIRFSKTSLTAKDLFHVPFELRNIINSNRYSIPGYPTLYLSNSVYLAYKELDRPDFENLFVSKFQHSQWLGNVETLLNMTNVISWNEIDDQFKYLVRWLLIMSCTITVGFPDSPFKPEYVLPQIILQWVKNNINVGSKKVIGVKYSSTKINERSSYHSGHFFNTAIPIHQSGKEGFCEKLAKQFNLTQPISFKEGLELCKGECHQKGQVEYLELNKKRIKYTESDFAKIEKTLSESPYSDLYNVHGHKYS